MKLELPDLPFAKDALEPHMSANTLDFHHGKHHNAYVVKGNELLEEAGLSADSLEQLVIESAKVGGGLFNNVGQHYNHSFYWKCLKPGGRLVVSDYCRCVPWLAPRRALGPHRPPVSQRPLCHP